MSESKTKRLEVVFCTDGIFPHSVGGMQRHSRLLIEELAKRNNVDLIVIHPHEEKTIFAEFPSVEEVKLKPLPQKKYYLSELYDYSKEVLKVIKKYPNAVVYSQGLSVWSGIKEVGQRVIVNPHGLEPYQTLSKTDYLKTAPFRAIFNYVFSNAKAVVSLGGRLTDILSGRVGKNTELVILPNATNLPDSKKEIKVADKVKCLFVGRFAYNKGIDIFMDSIEKINSKGLSDKFEFFLAGKGPLFDEYKEKYNFPNAHLLGFVSDEQLSQLYADCSVFVFPTLFEGMPTVVLEAMALSLPIIVTDVGATKE
ncbi:MAG: glycosyltransferase involved in cell wall biosynthesis, partial [Arenicella sp.]